MIHAKIYKVKETFNAHIACVSITMNDMTSAQKKKKKTSKRKVHDANEITTNINNNKPKQSHFSTKKYCNST